MYAKLENEKLVPAPKNLKNEDGIIFNYNQNTDLMLSDGYKPVEYGTCPQTGNFEYVVENYTEDADKITVNYEICNRPLEEIKQAIIAENEQKRNVEYIPTSLGILKTQTPLGDLKTALPLYDKIAAANNGLPQGAVRLYDAQGNVSLSPALTLEQYNAMTVELANAYLAIDAKSTQYTQAILAAQSLEELEGIEINYTVSTIR